jgi:hypothetical protein
MVAVADARSRDRFSIEVRDGDNAVDLFHHPYAYAAWRCPEFPIDESDPALAELWAA